MFHSVAASPAAGRQLVATPEDAPHVPWVPLDVARPDLERFPDFARAGVVEVSVRRGEMLYLPAMWYHQVEQRGLTVAVNYWHDMQFGHAYIQHQFLRDVVGLNSEEEERVEGEAQPCQG
mmetsp:Transcript_41898/g.97016  ORF Transcript_41898/g.97016 Transcript_41898/m.97016 type:complete len:120 (+) Transcript_41898:139-498(+)